MTFRDHLRPALRGLTPYAVDTDPARIRLDANESPFEPPESVRREIAAEVGRIPLNRYPDPAARELKEALSRVLGIDPAWILLGNGSDELIGYLVTAFTGRGRGVLYPVPTFSMYGLIARALGQPAREVPLEEGFGLPREEVARALEETGAEILFLASPNNPTGILYPAEEVLALAQSGRALVVADEAYVDYAGSPGLLPSLADHPELVVLRTLSKIGMAGLRIGVAAAHPDLLAELEKVRLPFNINALSQAAARVLLSHTDLIREWIGRVAAERERLRRGLAELPGVEVFPSRANFLLFRCADAAGLHAHLKSRGILVRRFAAGGRLAHCLRVTVGRPEENAAFLEETAAFAAAAAQGRRPQGRKR